MREPAFFYLADFLSVELGLMAKRCSSSIELQGWFVAHLRFDRLRCWPFCTVAHSQEWPLHAEMKDSGSGYASYRVDQHGLRIALCRKPGKKSPVEMHDLFVDQIEAVGKSSEQACARHFEST